MNSHGVVIREKKDLVVNVALVLIELTLLKLMDLKILL